MSLTKLNNQSLSAVTSAGLPAGTVLQTITANTTTPVSIAASWNFTIAGTETGLQATITPASTNNKLLITGYLQVALGYTANPSFALEVYDGTSVIYSDKVGSGNAQGVYINGDGNENFYHKTPFALSVTAPSTNSTTYKVRGFTSEGGIVSSQNVPSFICIQEIAG